MGSQGVGARTLLMPEPAPLPATIGPYRIVEMLGAGGMGAVYKGLDVSLERHVAIKVLSPALATDAESRERFLREARSAAVLSHPNVVSVYQIGEDAGRPYIAMELIDGSSLEDLLVERRRIPAPLAIAYVLQVVDGLDAAWKRGIVHRDIKPGNILIHADGYAKLADFGLSKAYGGDKSLTQSGMVRMGTPRYMSPEQEGEAARFPVRRLLPRATLYHMLAGSPPYDADTPVSVIVKHITSPIPSISAKDLSLPEPVCRVIEHMLQKRAEDRPATYDELREEPASPATPSALDRSTATAKRRRSARARPSASRSLLRR
ncbi:MAG: serine/threonine-protein kinase [Acidobacteriota bacterium]